MENTLSYFDYGVVAFYFLFMVGIGVFFRNYITNTSDYFRGGGQMVWWMAGSSAFMVQFSAWTFTGAASKAYEDGLLILVIFFGNAIGFLMNYLYFAGKFRQLRVITPIEAMRQRFGKTSEQVFTWLQLPIGTLYAGIWLNGLGVFFAAVFGFDIATTILVTGSVVLILSVTGGSWAVVASDFMQVLVLMPISLVAAYFALKEVGGPAALIERFPADRLFGGDTNYSALVWIWAIVILIKQFASTNNLMDASRYLCAKDTWHARRAALLASSLFIIGPVVWFIPPMASAILYPELDSMFPQLGEKSSEAAYVAICINTLPVGMLGLLLSGIFAATMSSMDSGLNRNAGIFVRNFYLPHLRPHAGERELLLAGKVATLVFGGAIIAAGVYFSRMKDLPLFDLMMQFGGLVAVPMQVPLIWGILVRRVPDWASWASILVGLATSYLVKTYLTAEWVNGALNLGMEFSGREEKDLTLIMAVVINLFVGSAFYLSTMLFYKEPTDPVRRDEVDTLFKNLNTPVESSEDGSEKMDSNQGKSLGVLSMIYGGFILLLALIPNEATGRIAFLFCGGVLLLIGYALKSGGKKKEGEGMSFR
ncbi:sodium:solute symporter family protein [Haloferula sp.]|uniref:sodium:solute symporter family protein n=1 Tax=Haloferula sp. TaxID=2497595 RepID=UPI00329CD719